MPYFTYSQKEIEYLKSKDAVLAKAIDEIGMIQREVIPDLFEALMNAIVGQQISTKAHRTVWQRFKTQLKDITPKTIVETDVEKIQKLGISMRKATYMKEVAQTVLSGKLDIHGLQAVSYTHLDVYKRQV